MPSWKGIVGLSSGIILFWLGELSGEFFTLYISFWFVLIGLCWAHLGWGKLKTIFFPLLFLLVMFPLPNYWFPQRGRILTNAYQLKIFAFWDALTKQRTDGALVRVITPVYEFEELADAEQRLQAFTRDIMPVLDKYIPGKEAKKFN